MDSIKLTGAFRGNNWLVFVKFSCNTLAAQPGNIREESAGSYPRLRTDRWVDKVGEGEGNRELTMIM